MKTHHEAEERLERAAHAVDTAKLLVQMEEATIRQFLNECIDMEDFVYILALRPLFENAIRFLDTHKAIVAVAQAALAAVDAKQSARRGGR